MLFSKLLPESPEKRGETMEGRSGKKSVLPVSIVRMNAYKHDADVFDLDQQYEKNPFGLSKFQRLLTDNSMGKIVAVYSEKKEKESTVVGFAMFKFDGPSIEIQRLIVDESFRRGYVGTRLLKRIISELVGPKKFLKCFVEESNKYAQLFLRKTFSEITERKNIFEDLWKDYYISYDRNGEKKYRNGIYFCYRKLDVAKYKIQSSP